MILSREVLLGVLFTFFIASVVGGLSYWKKYQERKMDELASLVYLYEQGKVSRAELEERLKGTPLYTYFLVVSGEDPSKAIPNVEDEQIRSFLREREAFRLYTERKYGEALSLLREVDEDKFNYPSALLLKAFTLQAKGDEKEATEIYRRLSKEYKGTYFGRIAYGFLLSTRDK